MTSDLLITDFYLSPSSLLDSISDDQETIYHHFPKDQPS